jgi:hypothetical protein
MERTATCHCGQFHVIAAGEPERVYLCHCKACQRRTGTAFHFGTAWQKAQIRVAGTHKVYERCADSGSKIRFFFCPDCGSNLYWESDRNPAGCGVAGGAFDERAGLPPPTSSVFEEDMHAWLGLPTVAEHHVKGRPPAAG